MPRRTAVGKKDMSRIKGAPPAPKKEVDDPPASVIGGSEVPEKEPSSAKMKDWKEMDRTQGELLRA